MGKNCLPIFALMLAATGVSIGVADAQKITVDPNTGGAAISTATPPYVDVRLAQKVTYEARHRSVKDILDDLSKQTNVVLNAGYNKQDWQVRDRKMIIFAKDISLAELMSSIARMMQFKWSKNDDVSPPTYCLVADRKLIAKMQAEQHRKEDELKVEVRRRRQSLADAIGRVSKMSDTEIEALHYENPYLYLIGKTGCAKLSQALFDEIPGFEDNFLDSRRNVLLSPSQLSPGTRQLLLDAMKGNWLYRQFQEGKNEAFPEGMEDALDRCKVGVEHLPRPLRGGTGNDQLSFYGGIGVSTPFGFCHIGYWYEPDSSVSQVSSTMLLRGVDEGKTASEVNDEFADKLSNAFDADAKDFDSYSSIEPRTEHIGVPDLHAKIKLKKPEPIEQAEQNVYSRLVPEHARCLQSIAEASGLSVVSDSFRRIPSGCNLGEGEKYLQDVIEQYAKHYDCNWEKHGSVIEFRNRDWFRKRSSQIPDEWMEQWTDSLKQRGVLSLAEFAQICMLDFLQIGENVYPDPVLGCCANPIWNLINNKALLCLYLRLSHDQRKMMFSESGLDSRSLSPEQYQYLTGVFDYGNAIQEDVDRFLKGTSTGLTLSAKTTTDKNGTITAYHFAASAEDGKPPFSWNVTLPTYSEAAPHVTPSAKK